MRSTIGAVTMALAAALAAATATASPAAAQDYPNRPITLVIPLPPGGTNDIMARAVADKLSAALGQQVVIENRAGRRQRHGRRPRQVARGPADGYTLLLGYTSTLATGPHMYPNVGYDPRKDFAPIGLIGGAPALLLVHPSVPVRNVGELIALMKSSTRAVPGRHARRQHGQSSGRGAVRPAGRRSSCSTSPTRARSR